VTAHWGVPDPADVADLDRRAHAFDEALALLSWRIDLMLALRTDLLERLVLEERLKAIASQVPPLHDIDRHGAS
jgi:hypothetical protein